MGSAFGAKCHATNSSAIGFLFEDSRLFSGKFKICGTYETRHAVGRASKDLAIPAMAQHDIFWFKIRTVFQPTTETGTFNVHTFLTQALIVHFRCM